MRFFVRLSVIFLVLALPFTAVLAEEDDPGKYEETRTIFMNAGQSSTFFENCYGYALFPTIGKGGLIVGAAHGKGRVYVGGKHVGDTTMDQVTVGLQAGGEAFSQIIFFQDKRAFDEFASGSYEFGAQAKAVAVTSGASAGSSTGGGGSAGASGGKNDAVTTGGYHKGMAVFTVAKGGLLLEASIGGQQFTYTAR